MMQHIYTGPWTNCRHIHFLSTAQGRQTSCFLIVNLHSLSKNHLEELAAVISFTVPPTQWAKNKNAHMWRMFPDVPKSFLHQVPHCNHKIKSQTVSLKGSNVFSSILLQPNVLKTVRREAGTVVTFSMVLNIYSLYLLPLLPPPIYLLHLP